MIRAKCHLVGDQSDWYNFRFNVQRAFWHHLRGMYYIAIIGALQERRGMVLHLTAIVHYGPTTPTAEPPMPRS